jgi:hypothetical protein
VLSAALIWVVAALLLGGEAARADDPAAQALLAKHRAFVGWQFGDAAVASLRLTGKAVDDRGQHTYDFTTLSRGLAYRTTYADLRQGGVLQDEGFTGNVVWQSNENGFTTPAFGDPAKAAIAQDLLFNEATSQLTGTSRGAATVDGTPVQIVRVALKDGFPMDVYIDPVSGAYLKAVIDPEGSQTTTVRILAYTRAAPGKKVIGSYRFASGSTWTVAKAEVNPPIADADLHPPAARALWTFSNPQPFTFTVTDKRFIVDAKVNGVAGRFLIDTGADHVYLTREFAAHARVKSLSRTDVGGIAGSAKGEVVRLNTLEIGGNTLSDVVAMSVGDSLDTDAPDGVIGFDLFGGAVVDLDSSTQRMTIQDPAQAPAAPADGVSMNVDLSAGVPSVPMKMDGRIAVNAELDSGNFYYVLFGKELISHDGLVMLVDDSLVGGLESHPVLGGVGGVEVERCGHVDSLSLGPIVYQQPPACASPSFSGRTIFVGFDFLRHFDYVFDYPHGRVTMIPHKE